MLPHSILMMMTSSKDCKSWQTIKTTTKKKKKLTGGVKVIIITITST
jgi:hypothetical protein